VECAQFNFRHRFGQTKPKVAEIIPNLLNFAQLGAQKTNHGSNFGQLGRYSTKIGGKNSTSHVQPFCNEFRLKKLL
jgi:hypothetical protein